MDIPNAQASLGDASIELSYNCNLRACDKESSESHSLATPSGSLPQGSFLPPSNSQYRGDIINIPSDQLKNLSRLGALDRSEIRRESSSLDGRLPRIPWVLGGCSDPTQHTKIESAAGAVVNNGLPVKHKMEILNPSSGTKPMLSPPRSLIGTVCRIGNWMPRLEDADRNIEGRLNSYKNLSYTQQTQIDNYRRQNDSLQLRLRNAIDDCSTHKIQIEKMSRTIVRLNKRGLPMPRDDEYFSRELQQLIGAIREWARRSSRRQPPVTVDNLKQLDFGTLADSFADLEGQLNSGSLSPKIRTRFLEVILCKALLGIALPDEAVFGLDDTILSNLWHIMGSMRCTNEEAHSWYALSVHLITKGADKATSITQKQKAAAEYYTNALISQLAPLGVFDEARSRGLFELVLRAAKLGLEVAQLPFKLRMLKVVPGRTIFAEKYMEDIESSGRIVPEQLEQSEIVPAIVLCGPVVKLGFDEDGALQNAEDPVVILKGRVACYC